MIRVVIWCKDTVKHRNFYFCFSCVPIEWTHTLNRFTTHLHTGKTIPHWWRTTLNCHLHTYIKARYAKCPAQGRFCCLLQGSKSELPILRVSVSLIRGLLPEPTDAAFQYRKQQIAGRNWRVIWPLSLIVCVMCTCTLNSNLHSNSKSDFFFLEMYFRMWFEKYLSLETQNSVSVWTKGQGL